MPKEDTSIRTKFPKCKSELNFECCRFTSWVPSFPLNVEILDHKLQKNFNKLTTCEYNKIFLRNYSVKGSLKLLLDTT